MAKIKRCCRMDLIRLFGKLQQTVSKLDHCFMRPGSSKVESSVLVSISQHRIPGLVRHALNPVLEEGSRRNPCSLRIREILIQRSTFRFGPFLYRV